MTTANKEMTEFNKYRADNCAEVSELVRLGVLTRKSAGNIIMCCDENYEDWRDMRVSDRVDLARDLEACS